MFIMQGTAGLAKIQGVQGPVSAAPAAPSAPGAATLAVPTTVMEIKVIRARRAEISSQIGNITDRRNEIAQQIRRAAPGQDRNGLEGRLAVLDKRIVELENDLSVTGQALASARGDAAITVDPPTQPANKPSSGQITAMSIVFFLAVLMPLSVAFGRRLVGRGTSGADAAASRDVVQRLDRMEEGIDAIAIEVERISEGQRFVSKALGSGAADPITVKRGDSVSAAADRR
jgi:hypothetical protein